jgi:hypothetical protein
LSVPKEVLCFTTAEPQIVDSKYKEMAGIYFHKFLKNAEIIRQEVAGVSGLRYLTHRLGKLYKSQKFRVEIRLINLTNLIDYLNFTRCGSKCDILLRHVSCMKHS